MCQCSAHKIRVNACVLRELRSRAMVCTASIGLRDTISRLRTRLLAAIARFGKTTRPSMRWSSIAGMMATSARRSRKSSAHCEGIVNDSSYLPFRGPCVKPYTRGAVLRYCTMEMRSFFANGGCSQNVQYSRPRFCAADTPFCCKTSATVGGFENDEVFSGAGTPAGFSDRPTVHIGATGRRKIHDDCGKNGGSAEAGRILQSLLGHQAGQVVA